MAAEMEMKVLSLRYSSWSIRPWLALRHAGAKFKTTTVTLAKFDPSVEQPEDDKADRAAKGSRTGLFPVLKVDGVDVHESLAIAEYAADAFPEAKLWPEDPLKRAQARALCMEMCTGFLNVRDELSCHPFARVPTPKFRQNTLDEVARIKTLWRESLEASGGPFLFGHFTIADAFYFPVVTRFRTYGIELNDLEEEYCQTMEAHPAVQDWREIALESPRYPIYDDYVLGLGGDPTGALE